jgi:hypothetical protein
MSGDVAISHTAPQSAAVPIVRNATTAPQIPDPVSVAVAASASSKRPLVNPSLHVDLALNLVVLQFIDDKGDVTNQIPSQKQLKAYQAQSAGSGPGGSASQVAQFAKGTGAPITVAPASAAAATLQLAGGAASGAASSNLLHTGVAQSYSASISPVQASPVLASGGVA